MLHEMRFSGSMGIKHIIRKMKMKEARMTFTRFSRSNIIKVINLQVNILAGGLLDNY